MKGIDPYEAPHLSKSKQDKAQDQARDRVCSIMDRNTDYEYEKEHHVPNDIVGIITQLIVNNEDKLVQKYKSDLIYDGEVLEKELEPPFIYVIRDYGTHIYNSKKFENDFDGDLNKLFEQLSGLLSKSKDPKVYLVDYQICYEVKL